MLTYEEVADLLEEQNGRRPTDAELAPVFVRLDQASIEEGVRAQFAWQVWDKESPINDVDPALVLARPDYPGGEIILVYIDGQLAILQPHHPGSNQPILENEAEQVAQALVDDLVRGRFAVELVNRFNAPVQ